MNHKYTSILVICSLMFSICMPLLGDAQDMTDYTAYPPFITSGVKPNLLLMIDNSASMNDLQYMSETSAECYDDTFDKTASYVGYFEEDAIYMFDSGSGLFIDKGGALSASCVHRTDYLCVDITGGSLDKFEASGKFLNWLSASKMDVLKKILTGGKYDATSGYLEAVSRGCQGRRLIKAAPLSDFTSGGAITFGARGKVDDPLNVLEFSYGGNTEIEIYDGSFDSTPCRAAATLINESQGQFKGAVDDCLALGKLDDKEKEKLKGAGSSFNHTVHGCYKETGGDPIPNGTVNATMSSCAKLYGEMIAPGDIQPNNIAYMCADRRKVCTNTDPIVVCDQDSDCPAGETCQNSGFSGFLGECWVDANPKVNEWSKSGQCEEDQMYNFCDYLNVPKVMDPSAATTELEDLLYLPAFLMDTGLFAQAGPPIAQLPVKIERTSSPTGLIHEFENTIRMGIMNFNYCGSASEKGSDPDVTSNCVYPDFAPASDRDGGLITGYIGESGIVDAVNDVTAMSWTPFAEAYYNAIAYFVKDAGNANLDPAQFTASGDAIKEPLNPDDFDSSSHPNCIEYRCQENNILIISDGASTADINSTMTKQVTLSSLHNDGDMGDPATCGGYSGSPYLDDLSYYAYNRNIFNPSDSDPDDDELAQKIKTYVVYTGPEKSIETGECAPKTLMENTALNGGTELYTPQDPSALEFSLKNIWQQIAKGSASGTSVSVLATTGDGEGAVYQAFFYPEKMEGIESRKWLGYVHALFIDKWGNLREDTVNRGTLDLKEDYIIEIAYSSDIGTVVKRFPDLNGDGEKDSPIPSSTVSLDNIEPLWRGGKELWNTSPARRSIFTTIDGTTSIDFTNTNSALLLPYLRAADVTESDNIINWVLGEDLTSTTDVNHPAGYRNRNITIGGTTNVWKLGDIIYSTPTVVGRPMENYDLLYGDNSYTAYRAAHINRRQVLYVGANDGMLHAFNAGCFDAAKHRYYPDVDANGCATGSHTLGQELWGFIPRGLLPHLTWQTDPDYTHVYYVDLKPKVTDIRVFTADSDHKNGWGTILIGGFRYGGKDISWTSGGTDYSASPEYFALDITDPLNPRLLWTFTDPDLGLSMTYPAVAKIGDKWYAIFGSGATDYDVVSNLTTFQDGNIFVLEISGGNNGVINSWAEGVGGNFWKIPTDADPGTTGFLADPVTVDVDLDNNVDVIYMGENYTDGVNWNALMHRMTTGRGTVTPPWTTSTLGNISSISGGKDLVRRITAPPSAAMDDRANLWVFFGTGQFLGAQDRNDTDTGAFYAIKDGCWDGHCATSYTDILDASDSIVKTDGSVSGISSTCAGTTWSTLSTSCDGWALYFDSLGESIDFTGNILKHDGERLLSKPLVLGGLVAWATYVPGADVCSTFGESNVYAVYYKTGTAYTDYVFKEQKEQTSPSDKVARVKKLGVGMPSSLSAQITDGGTAKGFAQSSTGSILEIESITPLSMKSALTGWMSQCAQ